MGNTKKALVPKLRFKGFGDTWSAISLKELTTIITKGTTPQSFSDKGINYVKIEGIVGVNINKEKCLYIDEKTHNNELRRSILKNNDLLFAIAGATIGKVAIVTEDILPANTNQALAIIRLKNTQNLKCILQILQSRIMKKYIRESISVGAQPNLNLEQIGNFRFHLPTLPEQQKIASFLSAVDDKIRQLTRKKELLEQYKKGVMQQLFTGKLRFKDDKGKAFPEWEEKRLGEIGEFQTSSIDKKSIEGEKSVYLVNYMNVYRHEDLNRQTIGNLQIVTARDNQITSCNLKRGDILFTPSSETPDDIGHSVVIFEDLENCVYSYHLMRFRPKIEIDILYSHYFCNIPSVLKQLTNLATGSTRFTISVKSFSSIVVNLPSIEEQQKIAAYLSSIDSKLERVSGQIEQMQTFKKGLLQQMFV